MLISERKDKWKMITAILVFMIIAAFFIDIRADATPVSSNGQLQVKKTKIVNSKGRTFVMKGLCINWDWSEKEMIYGANAYKVMRDKWGVNTIRVNTWPEVPAATAMEKVGRVVKDATNAGLYVVINFGIWYEDPNRADYKKNAREFFAAASKKWGNNPAVMYEICNEPKGSWKNIKKFADEIIPIIRKNDKNSIIIVGTPDFCTDVSAPVGNLIKDPNKSKSNIAYTLHSYANWIFESKLKKAVKAGMCLVATEFDPIDASNNKTFYYNDATKRTRLLNRYSIGRMVWVLRGVSAYSIVTSTAARNGNWTDADLTENGRWMVKLFTGRTVKVPAKQVINKEPAYSSKSGATTLTSGKKVTKRTFNPVVAHWYKINIKKQGYFTITYERKKGDKTAEAWLNTAANKSKTILQYDLMGANCLANGTSARFLSRSLTASMRSYTTGKIPLMPGTYYLRLYPTSSFSSAIMNMTYNLKYSFTSSKSWEQEPNERNNPTVLGLNKTVNASMMHDENDWFRVNITDKRNYYLRFKHARCTLNALAFSGNLWKVTVMNQSGSWSRVFYYKKNQTTWSKNALGSLAKGTYYIHVESQNWRLGSDVNYNVKISK